MTDPTRQAALAEKIYRAVLDASCVPGSNYPEVIARVLAAHETAHPQASETQSEQPAGLLLTPATNVHRFADDLAVSEETVRSLMDQVVAAHPSSDVHQPVSVNVGLHPSLPNGGDSGEHLDQTIVTQAGLLGARRREVEDLQQHLAAAEARSTALTHERDELQDAIEAFNRNDHDQEGAAMVWCDCYREAQRGLVSVTADRDRLRMALEQLVQRLEVVHANPHYVYVWFNAQNHGGPYEGPTYTAELEAARAALASPRVPASADPRLVDKTEDAARERKNALNGLRRYEFTTRVQKRTANDPEVRDTDFFVLWREVEPWI